MTTAERVAEPPSPRATAAAIAAAGERLVTAHSTRTPCAPVRDLIGSDDIAAAYRVQEHFNAERVARGARVVGRKIGATSAAVQQQLGVDQPDFGVLFDDMAFAHAATIPMSRLIQPKVEAEVAFVLVEDLDDGPLDDARIRAAIGEVRAALEIVDSRITGWDITFGDTVADNASSGLYVLGEQHCTLAQVEPVDVTMTMTIDGSVASTGSGAACLGDPLHAVAWLAHQARRFGEPLRAGQVVLSGALGPMRPAPHGAEVTARISGLGEVTARFNEEECV
jgi:2-keto-4-pentenoate hydratase